MKFDVKIDVVKVYRQSPKDQVFIDEIFDKFYQQNKFEWTTRRTKYGYPVFVVWRTVNGQKKGRVVIDIRGLNKITETDTYPMPLQEDITSAVISCFFITVIDAASFYLLIAS